MRLFLSDLLQQPQKKSNMLSSKDSRFTLDHLITQICKQGFCNRPQLLYAVWQSTKRVITTNWSQGRQTMLSNLFIARGNRQFNKYYFYLQPTETLLADCSLKYRAESNVALQAPTVIGETNLFKGLNPPQKEYFKNDKELILRFFYLIIGKVKDILKAHRNLEILFEHFGIIRVNEKTYFFESFKFNDKGSLSSPNLHKYKRFSSTKKDTSGLQRSGDQSKYSSRILQTSGDFKKGFNLRKRPYFHEVIVENQPSNVKVCGDLLGAGIDPLTYDYSYSKLADHSPELLATEFKKQDHAQGRFPCVIDKFARTKGSQLTGIKVGNSIVVRIGSNYNPTAKNYYLDITSKSIQLVTPETKIKLQNNRQRVIQPASEEEEYLALTQGRSPHLQGRVQLRKEMYHRYCQYYQEIIPNDCVAPLNQDSVARIIKQVKGLVKKIGRKDGSPLINSLMNEVNTQYYLAYKKSVLNYILRDKQEMLRIGISLTFTPQTQWGKPTPKKALYQATSLNLAEARRILELNHILYPECLNKIYEENEKLTTLQIFKKRKEGEYRPYNILYYIKRNINQLNEAYSFLCDNWVKKISVLIEEYINLKLQNYQKLKQFFNSIHIVMSNKLKELLYTTLNSITQEFSKCEYDSQESKNLLMINMTEEGEKICFIDDIEKVFKFQLMDIIDKIVEVTRRIPRVENCLKLSTEMFIWGIDPKDSLLQESKRKIKETIDENYTKILGLRERLSTLEAVFKLKEEIVAWCKQPFKVQELKTKLSQIQLLQREIMKVSSYYKVSMVVVDCIQLKRKMILYLKSLKKLLFDSVQERVKQRNAAILAKINSDVQLVSKSVSSTTQFVSLAHDIQQIKLKEMASTKAEIDNSYKDVMNLFAIQGFSANFEVMKSTYLCRQSFEELYYQLFKNERRLTQERLELQKKLREKISQFQSQTLGWLKEINSKIDTFDMRKLYSQYLAVLVDYQSKVDSNRQVQKILNTQQQDLKWAMTTFTHAIQLQNIVEPNYELWQLVSQYDTCIKQWKYIELSHFDIQNNEVKVNNIDNRITRLITKLKNFAGLKIVYDLQNDVKEFLVQQVPIIKIFSNPGLKDRHWSLFNKRLPLPGYDLKELTYGRIKLLYEYEKNLKVLMSISNQAAKQFEIQNEKQEMFDYWSKLNFSLFHASDQNIIFINQNFLDEQIEVIEHHLTKTVILKNSPFSKALVQMLSEWEGWLINGRKILTGFRASQEKFTVVRSIFKMDEISKILPIESTEYDSIENIWKSVIKKILEQPKVTEFFKSQKMPEIIEEIGKKADFIRNSFNTYLNLKRLEFNRLYFLPQRIVLNLIEFLASDRIQQAYSLILQHCFIGITSATRDDSSTFHLNSRTDNLQIMCESIHSKKGKAKFFEELVVLQKNMRENIKKQLKEISYLHHPILEMVDAYTLTAIFTYLQLQFGSMLKKKQSWKEIQLYYKGVEADLIHKLKEFPCLKYENLLSKVLFLVWRCRELSQRPYSSNESILQFCENDEDFVLKIYNSSIKFQYEYLGDQMPCYLPSSTDRLVWSIAFSMANKVGILCDSNCLIRQIALFTGQYFVRVENPLHSIQSNFQSCIMGTISTNYWVHFSDQHIKASVNLLALLTHTLQMKKERIGRSLSTLTFKNNEISINTNTCVFLSIDPQRTKELPQGILTCMRVVTFVKPSIVKFKDYISRFQLQEKLRNFMFAIKPSCQDLKPNEILKDTFSILDWQLKKSAIKDKIWRILSAQQRQDFNELFQEKQPEETEYKTWAQFKKIKENEMNWGLVRHSVVLAVGKQSCKSQVIQKILTDRGVDTLFDENRGVNLNFIEEGASQLNYVKYLQKAKEKLLKFNEEIIIYIDCDLSAKHLQAISMFQHMHSLSLEHMKPMKIIVETCSVQDLDPKLLTSFAIISFHPHHLVNLSTYQEWVRQLSLTPQDKASVSQLEMSFQGLLSMVLKMEKRFFNDSRPALTKRFFSYFSIYLQHLNSKEVERMCEFDRENYIFNSFIYCAFWALGGNLRAIQVEALKKQIRESYAEKLDIPGELNEIYLNEQNEWVYWQSLKEDFVSEKENVPVYQIWVPTANNTKILTMLIKLLQKNNSILLCGSQSGRSSIFSEISSFELSYSTFLLDCHAKTSLDHITSLTRGRIIYGDFKKNLILVDDVHLPQVQVCDIFRTFQERGYCANSSLLGKLNEDIFKPSILASWQGSEQSKRCFWRFYERMIPLDMQKFGQGELESIFRTYFNSLPVSNQVDNNFLKLQNIIVNYCLHTIKVFPSISISSVRLLVQSMCRCNYSRDESTTLQHLLAQSQSILQAKLPAHQITHFYRHMSYYYGKLVSIQLKNHNEIKQVAEAYLYDVRSTKQADKKETAEQLGHWIHECISQKGNEYFISPFHIKILQRVVWTLKANNSHVILLSNIKNGSHSLAKISGWLLKIGVIELQQVGVNGLLEQVVKVLKTGGKVDECMSILTHQLYNARPELIKLVNSLIFSPQFHECFGQILMEQIIKSFNSEKKFLKKNVKKSELIKKIRQKFNGIFHLCLCLTRQAYESLITDYPRFGNLRVIQVGEWPSQALSLVSKKFISNQSQEVLRVFLRIEEELKSNWQLCGGRNISKGVLKMMATFDRIMKFMQQKAKSQEESTELWSKRIRLSQQKLENLQKEKKLFESQHTQYFQKMETFGVQIVEATTEAEKAKEKQAQLDQDVEQYKLQCNRIKVQFDRQESQVHMAYLQQIQTLKQKLTAEAHKYKTSQKLQIISLAYEFPTDNLEQQITQFLFELEKDYFHKLMELDYSELGAITIIIDKFKDRMEALWTQQNYLSKKFKEYQNMNLNAYQSGYKLKQLDDRVSILKDDQSELRENQEATMKAYEDIRDKIAQVESINSILLKFQHILKSKNELCIPVPKNMNGCAILVTCLLTYSSYLAQSQIVQFLKMVTFKSQQLKMQTTIKELLSFFPYELQFKILYQHQSNITEVVNLFGLEASDIACVGLGSAEDIVDWLDRVTQNRHLVWMKNNDDIKELLQRDQLILIKNPESSLVERISSLLSKPFVIRNNTKILIVEDQEITIHENSRCFFIFNSQQEIPQELLVHNLFIFRICLNTQDKVLHFLQSKLNEAQMIPNRQDLVSNYLKGCREIGMMDQKLHSIIMKMKKQNVVSEIIYKKIEQEGENKSENERKLEKYKLEISEIGKFLNDYRGIARDIANNYAQVKEAVTFKEFRYLLGNVAGKLAADSLNQLPSKISVYLDLLLKQGSSKKIKDVDRHEFQDLTLRVLQKSSIALLAPDVSLVFRFVKLLLSRSLSPTLDIAPQDISINNIKEGCQYICLIYRFEHWKQTLTILESHKEKFAGFRIIFIVLDSVTVPPEMITAVPTISIRRIGELMMENAEKQANLASFGNFKMKKDRTLYQQQLEYRAFLNENKAGKQAGKLIKSLLELE